MPHPGLEQEDGDPPSALHRAEDGPLPSGFLERLDAVNRAYDIILDNAKQQNIKLSEEQKANIKSGLFVRFGLTNSLRSESPPPEPLP